MSIYSRLRLGLEVSDHKDMSNPTVSTVFESAPELMSMPFGQTDFRACFHTSMTLLSATETITKTKVSKFTNFVIYNHGDSSRQYVLMSISSGGTLLYEAYVPQHGLSVSWDTRATVGVAYTIALSAPANSTAVPTTIDLYILD